MKKIAIIGTAGVPAKYGGFETLAHHLVQHMSKDYSLSVYCSSKFYEKDKRPKYWNGARLFYIPLNANGASSIIYDILSMIHALFFADILLILGVSGGVFIPFIRLFSKKKVIVNIDGLEWRRDKWSTWVKRFLHASEKLAVRYSHIDITDNEAIKRYTSIYYKTLSVQIEYGADHVKKVDFVKEDKIKYPFIIKPFAFKVARIEPENNVHLILKTFAEIEDKTLVIVGNWDHSGYGKDLKRHYSKYKNIYLLDPIYEQYDLDILRSNCFVYIHGHSAGGTNPSLVEAMYLGLPVVAFDVNYNRATTSQKALYFKSSEELKNLINKTRLLEYRSIGLNLKGVAMRRYNWALIAVKYSNVIKSLDYNYNKKALLAVVSTIDSKVLDKIGLSHLKHAKLYYE